MNISMVQFKRESSKSIQNPVIIRSVIYYLVQIYLTNFCDVTKPDLASVLMVSADSGAYAVSGEKYKSVGRSLISLFLS